MRHRLLAFAGALAVASVAVKVASIPVAGQSAAKAQVSKAGAALKTQWGDPDLQGTWTNHHQVPLERPAQYAGREFLTEQELAALDKQAAENRDRPPAKGQVGLYNDFWLERGKRANRTSLIVDPPDGKLPPMTPEAQKKVDPGRRVARVPTSYADRDAYERCITRGMPGAMYGGFYNHNYQVLQAPGYVVIHVEMIHDARIIPLDGRPHLAARVGQWMGDSRGHWEGDTLVVETTNFNGLITTRDQFAFGTASGGRVVERFRRVDRDTIDYRFTVDDPATFTKPWTAVAPMEKIGEGIFEYACHEGNYALVDMLTADK